jgi:hypothetical protein
MSVPSKKCERSSTARDRDGIAFAITFLLLAMLVALLLVPQDQTEMLRTFTPEHIELLDMFDSRGQQRAHRVLVVLLAALGVAAFVSRRRGATRVPQSNVSTFATVLRDIAGVGVLAGIAIWLFLDQSSLPRNNYYAVQGTYYPLALIPSGVSQILAMAAGAVAVLACCWAARQRAIGKWARALTITSGLVLLTYVVLVCATAFALAPDLSAFTADGVSAIEWHYSGNLGAGDHLASGMPLSDVPLNAGLLSALLLAISERALRILSFGTHIRIVQALQITFIALAAAAFWQWYRPRWLPALLAMLLVLPWIMPLHVAILYPNQSAWRFLGLAGAVLALASLYRAQPARSAGYLGVVAGAAIAWNVESGLCASAAFATFLILRRSTGRSGNAGLIGIALRFGCGLALAFAALAILIRAGLGYWPDPFALLDSFPLIGQFAGGYGGIRLARIDPLACLVFAHALFAVVRGLLEWRHGHLDHRNACRIAFATLIVLWSAYYFKAPHLWNLWSLLFLYGFLLGDLLPVRLSSLARRPAGRVLASFSGAAVALIVLPAILFSNALTVRSELSAARVWASGRECSGKITSGICLSQQHGDALDEKAASLAALLDAHKGAIYLTSNSYFMPLMTGAFQPLRERDAFLLTLSNADFQQLVAELRRLDPSCLVFDAPDSVFQGSVFHRKFYQRLRSAVPVSYSKQESVPGWDVRCK